MRIWHEDLIPKLCQKHLTGLWNEANQVYEIITCEKITYKGKKYRKYCNTCGTENNTDRCDNLECKKYNHDKGRGKRLDGYFNHPATQEFINAPEALFVRLRAIRQEMVARGYKPKELPLEVKFGGTIKEWQTLEEQIEILKNKGCNCKI